MDKSTFDHWFSANSMATVCLALDVWPDWAKNARDPKVDQIFFWPNQGPQRGQTYDFQTANGRLTVLRFDADDLKRGFPYNKDVYIMVCASNDTVWQYGPYSKGEPDHWLESIPHEYEGWPTVSAAGDSEDD
jgi:hypothetical protein